MTNYIIVHDPHSSPVLVGSHQMIIDPAREIEIVTDWYVSELIRGDETVSFPYSRLICEVERFRPDPAAEARCQGFLYTRTLSGEVLRQDTASDLVTADRLYREYHQRLASRIEEAVHLMKVILVDAHSFSDLQAERSGVGSAPPHACICLGFNGDNPPEQAKLLRSYFTSVGLTVGYNAPFTGSLIPDRYRDNPDVTSVMIEINKRLYLKDPTRPEKDERAFTKLREVMATAISLLSEP